MSSPTQLSLAHLRKTCSHVAVVEKWIPCSPMGFKGRIIRLDLWGFDLACLRGSEMVLVQTTTRGNMNARIKKLADMPTTEALRMAGIRLLVHGWSKKGAMGKRKLWTLEEVDVS